MKYIDICSGLSAPTLAWAPLGWEALCYAEIAAAPRAVLKHHYPDVPLHGDFTKIKGDEHEPADILVGGTPCQDYSISGLRAGLDGADGELTLEFARLAYRVRPRWMLWENVAGTLSSNEGRDFGAILGTFTGRHGYVFGRPADGWRNSGIVEPVDGDSYGVAWRVLDARHFGVPQSRRRLFVVGYHGDWRPSAAVLFERHSFAGHPAPRSKAGKATASTPDGIAGAVSSKWHKGSGGPAGDEWQNLIAYRTAGDGGLYEMGDVSAPLTTATDKNANLVAYEDVVRRFTPRECERLQGIPDDFTLVPYRGGMMKDVPRYIMIGNSQPVPVIRWLGERIAIVDQIVRQRIAA